MLLQNIATLTTDSKNLFLAAALIDFAFARLKFSLTECR
jgi:hypothetical protein